MTLMQRVLTTSSVLFCLALPALAPAQTEERDRSKIKQETTIVGCLSKGEAPDEFILTDQKAGTKVTVKGVPELDKHATHTVKLTGVASDDGKSFTASKVDHVSDSCEPPKE